MDSLVVVRGIHFAATATLAGLIPVVTLLVEPAFRRAGLASEEMLVRLRRRFIGLAWTALIVGVGSGFAWLMLLAAQLSGPSSDKVWWDVVGTILTQTRFGEIWLTRFGLAALLTLVLARYRLANGWRWPWPAAAAVLLSICLIASLAGAGHSGANPTASGIVQLVGDALHLAAAGIWIGGLAALALIITYARRASRPQWTALAADVAARFSQMGIVVVAILLLSGILNAVYLVESVAGLFGTTYGHLLLAKIGLFVAMVALAAVNRLVLLPRLRAVPLQAKAPLARLARNSFAEIVLGVAILAIVGLLGTIPPAAHTQPVWPFPVRWSLEALNDSAKQAPAILTLAAGALAVGCLAAGLLAGRRLRWIVLAVGLGLMLAAAPGLQLFAVDAYPTSFYRSPTGFSVSSIAAGTDLFAQHCALCHGEQGRGDGPAARELTIRPADLTAEHVYGHADGDLFWWISHGIGDVMPPLDPALGERAPWSLIDFIHANADATRLRGLEGAAPVRAFPTPDFAVDCPDGSSVPIEAFRGRIVRLVFAGRDAGPSMEHLGRGAPENEIATLVVRLSGSEESGSLCGTDDPDVATAFALYRKMPVEHLEGTQFLIDASGALRAVWYPGIEPSWNDPRAFATEVARMRATAAAKPQAPTHAHVH